LGVLFLTKQSLNVDFYENQHYHRWFYMKTNNRPDKIIGSSVFLKMKKEEEVPIMQYHMPKQDNTMNLPSAVFTTEQVHKLERLSQEKLHMTEEALMECAGAAALSYLQSCWPLAKRIAIVCGTGNNAGDGYVLARLAFTRDIEVTVWQVGDSAKLQGAAEKAAQSCYQADIPVRDFDEFTTNNADVLVDAVLGIGLKGKPRDAVALAIAGMNQVELPILSLDLPSGLDADTGDVPGEAIFADATITFIGLKQGMLTHAGVDHCGEISCDHLQIPTMIFDHVLPEIQRIAYEKYQPYFWRRRKDTHKGSFGHVLVVGGAPGYSGAVRITAEAAARTGAGLVSVAYHEQNADTLSARHPEIMAHAVDNATQLQVLVDQADVLVIGPGLGQSEWSKDLFECVMASDKPKLIDADGLNLLAKGESNLGENVILTPHPGEAARLLGVSTEVVQQDRFAAIKVIHDQYQSNCVLKGAGSIIMDHTAVMSICTDGNPGMASAGMGDLLSGIIAGLMAQHFSVDLALQAAVAIHAKSGDMAAREYGERGLLAMDLIPFIRQLVNSA
jgi:hydroxyethylthiazole kinase-like uncharacterized protein yjeF